MKCHLRSEQVTCGLIGDIQLDDVARIESTGSQSLFTLRRQLSFNRTLPFSFRTNRSLFSSRRKERQRRGTSYVGLSKLRIRIEGSHFAQRNIGMLILSRPRVTRHPITRTSCYRSRSAFNHQFIKKFAHDINAYYFIIAHSNTLFRLSFR